MNTSNILTKKYYEIFECNKDEIKSKYKILLKEWHPDLNKSKDAIKVSTYINQLHKEAVSHFESNTWKLLDAIRVTKKSGEKVEIKYKYKGLYELGEYFVGDSILVYSFNKQKFYNNYLSSIKNIKYADDRMKTQFKILMPEIIDNFEADNNTFYIVIKKYPELYPLKLISDILNKDVHAAWVNTKLLNLCNFLQYNKLVHNGISIENCFVNPELHTIHLYGGWQYATKENEKMIGTTKSIFENMNMKVRTSKQSSYSTDVDASKYIVKSLLNSMTYVELKKNVKDSFAQYLSSPSNGNSFDELEKWEKAMIETFGKRKFVKVEINENNIYEKGGN